jgi:hypothetical protein
MTMAEDRKQSPSDDAILREDGDRRLRIFIYRFLLPALTAGGLKDPGYDVERNLDLKIVTNRLWENLSCVNAFCVLEIARIPNWAEEVKTALRRMIVKRELVYDKRKGPERLEEYRQYQREFLRPHLERITELVKEAIDERRIPAKDADKAAGLETKKGEARRASGAEAVARPPVDPADKFLRDPVAPPNIVGVNVCDHAEILDSLKRLRETRERLNAEARDLCSRMNANLLDRAQALAEGKAGPGRRNGKVLALSPSEAPEDLWFVGDVHGDLPALETALAYIEHRAHKDHPGSPPAIVFLGDLFDDGRMCHDVMLRVFQLILGQDGGNVCILAGNHDEALKYDASADRFSAGVVPCEYSEQLEGELREDPVAREVGRLAVRLFDVVPRAVFLPDGLLAAHGGVPHVDLCERMEGGTARELQEFERADCLQDFTWTRLHERMPQRIPNRASKGCELGYKDFFRFCLLTESFVPALPHAVDRMIRGHDHFEERFRCFTRYGNRVLTINTMCMRTDRDFGPSAFRAPCVARWSPNTGGMPEVHQLVIPEEIARTLYPTASAETPETGAAIVAAPSGGASAPGGKEMTRGSGVEAAGAGTVPAPYGPPPGAPQARWPEAGPPDPAKISSPEGGATGKEDHAPPKSGGSAP